MRPRSKGGFVEENHSWKGFIVDRGKLAAVARAKGVEGRLEGETVRIHTNKSTDSHLSLVNLLNSRGGPRGFDSDVPAAGGVTPSPFDST